MKTPQLIVIIGETASGKSALAIELARTVNGEVICADSRTIYKGMDIGTAKPSKTEMHGIDHHLLDVVAPDQTYNVARFKSDALDTIDDITKRGKLAIMAGGTGLYTDAVLFDYQFTSEGAARDPQNPRHLLKETTETALTNLQQLRPNTLVIGLKIEKEKLEQKIIDRVEKMVREGLVDEAATLGKKYGWDNKIIKGSDYRFIGEYLNGRLTLEEAKAMMVRADMNLAKRQRTWFKRNKYIHWINDPKEALSLVKTFLSQAEH